MQTIMRQDDVRRRNQFSILAVLRRHGALSRTAMSTLTGLSASTVTVITNALLEKGVITNIAAEGDSSVSVRRGRPQVLLAPNGDFARLVVLRLARGLIEGVLYDYSGCQISTREVRESTLGLTADGLFEKLVFLVDDLLEKGGVDRSTLARITLAVEGIVDGSGLTLLSTPVAPVHNVPLSEMLGREFDVHVEILNDCNALAEGLSWRSEGSYGKDFATILLATGVGMGLYVHGKMFSGYNSSAMEFGHMIYKPGGARCRCGRRGCIEAYAGIYAMWRAAQGDDPDIVSEVEPPDSVVEIMVEKARAGEGPEREAFREAGRAIGMGLVNLFTLFDSLPVVFTGPGTIALEFMIDEISAAFSNRSFGLQAEPAIVDIFPDSASLMREGTMMRSLIMIDTEISDQDEKLFENSMQQGR